MVLPKQAPHAYCIHLIVHCIVCVHAGRDEYATMTHNCDICNSTEHTTSNCPDARPGSPKAWRLGCTCAVLDNHYGRGFFIGDDPEPRFYITRGCPIHNPTGGLE